MIGHQLYAANQVNLGAILTTIAMDLKIPLSISGTIATLFAVGIIVSSILGTFTIRRKNLKPVLFFGIFLFSVFALLEGFSSSTWDLSLYRFGLGVGEGLWNISYFSFLGLLFAEIRGLLSSLAGNMYNLGLIWAYPFMVIMTSLSGSWRIPLYILGLLGIFTSFLLLVMVPSTRSDHNMDSNLKLNSSTRRNRNVSLGSLIGFISAVIFFAVANFYPTYLITRGFSPEFSSLIMSIQGWSMFVSRPPILYLSDKQGRKRWLYFASILSIPVTYLMFNLHHSDFTPTAAISIIYGIVSGLSFPLTLVFIQDSVAKDSIIYATSVYNAAYYTGGAITGFVTSSIISTMGWEVVGAFLALLSFMLFLAVAATKEIKLTLK
jgi:predicted MFS family arabinose efflux permease